MGNSPSSQANLHDGRRRSRSRAPHSRQGSRTPNHRSSNGRLSIIATSGGPIRRSHSATPHDRRYSDDELPPPYRPDYSRSGSYTSTRNSSSDKLEVKRKSTKSSSNSNSPASEKGKAAPWDEAAAREIYSKRVTLATSSILKQFHTVVVVDDSSSMREGGRWDEARNALSELAEFAVKYDTDGIDIHFLNNSAVERNVRNPEDVRTLFNKIQPSGVTNIGTTLEKLISEYLDDLDEAEEKSGRAGMKKIKPVNYIVITDGEATDDPESVIVQAAKRLDAKFRPITQIGIQFVQIGPLQSAARFLAELDDALVRKHKIRDIVDTTRYSGKKLNAEMLIKILVGGINRRVDAEGARVFRADHQGEESLGKVMKS